MGDPGDGTGVPRVRALSRVPERAGNDDAHQVVAERFDKRGDPQVRLPACDRAYQHGQPEDAEPLESLQGARATREEIPGGLRHRPAGGE